MRCNRETGVWVVMRRQGAHVRAMCLMHMSLVPICSARAGRSGGGAWRRAAAWRPIA